MNVDEHRPVALLPVPAKIFESIIHDQIFKQVGNIIRNNQRGFYPGRGVHTNLACFTLFVLEQIESGTQVNTVYTDFQKAFDKAITKYCYKK